MPRDVAAVTFDLIEVILDFVESQWWRLLALVLGVSHPATRQEQDTSENPRNKCSVHARTLYQYLTGKAALSRLKGPPNGVRVDHSCPRLKRIEPDFAGPHPPGFVQGPRPVIFSAGPVLD